MKINLFIILLNIVVEIQSLVELPVVEDNSIAITVTAIQDTLNNLFTSFKIQNIKHSSKLNQYFTIHKLFVSITLRDCDSWKKIASLARVNDIDNKTIYFITLVNEVLNEGNNNNAADDFDNKIFSWRLEYLKNWYTTKRSDFAKGDMVMNTVDSKKSNYDAINNNSKTNDDEFWQPSGRRIYQGSRTNIRNFPFMASVQFFGRFQCAGSIIKSDLVITAASCLQLAWNNRFFRENPTYLTVQIGSHFYEHGGETVQIQEIYFHPKYDPKVLRHNLAVMRMSRKIVFTTKSRRVKKIDIDRKARKLFARDRITIVGWGARDRSNIIYNVAQNKLSYAKLDFFPLDECQEYYSKKYVTKRNFCAGFFSKGAGACNRDVGGPGVIDGVLIGVISFASPVCGAPGPTVFTKLGFYADWIEDIMNQDVPSVAMATTKLLPKIYYNDINTETTATVSFTPLGDTTPPWMEALETITKGEDLRTGGSPSVLILSSENDDGDGRTLPISSNENTYPDLDTTSILSPETTVMWETQSPDYNIGGTRMEPVLSPSTIHRHKKRKSTSTVTTTTVEHTRKIKRKKVKHTSTSDTLSDVETTTEPLLSKVEQENVLEKALVEIINNIDIDRIVNTLEPTVESKLSLEFKRKKRNKKNPLREGTTTNQQGQTHQKRFLL